MRRRAFFHIHTIQQNHKSWLLKLASDLRVGGVEYEHLIVATEVVASIDTTKFIPILRRSNPSKKTPSFLGPRLYIDFEKEGLYEGKLIVQAAIETPTCEAGEMSASEKSVQVKEVYAQAVEDARQSAEEGKRGAVDTVQIAPDSSSMLIPGSTGLPIQRENQIKGLVHEAVVHWRLAGAGYNVINLNVDFMNNFPMADLVAHNREHRLLVQVRGAGAASGSFRIRKTEIERFDKLARALDTHGVYAFVFGQVGIEYRTTTMMLKKPTSGDDLGRDAFLRGNELATRLDQMINEQE